MPERIQRKRTFGWRMPANTIYVGRPSRWGNLYNLKDRQASVDAFRTRWTSFIAEEPDALPRLQRNLGGKNLACWCPLDQPCHADVLLELANPPDPAEQHGGPRD
jgi:hypothetical protein